MYQMLSLWTTGSWYPASLTLPKIEPQLPHRTEMLILLLTQATMSNHRVGPNTKFPDMRFLDYCSHVFHPPSHWPFVGYHQCAAPQ